MTAIDLNLAQHLSYTLQLLVKSLTVTYKLMYVPKASSVTYKLMYVPKASWVLNSMHTIYNMENLRDEKNIQYIDFRALFGGRLTP